MGTGTACSPRPACSGERDCWWFQTGGSLSEYNIEGPGIVRSWAAGYAPDSRICNKRRPSLGGVEEVGAARMALELQRGHGIIKWP